MKLTKENILYTLLGVISVLFFVSQLYKSISGRYLEMDIWTLLPTVLFHTENMPLLQKIGFFFNGDFFITGNPALKIFLYIIPRIFGVSAANFIFSLLFLHIINTLLVFLMGRSLGLKFKASLFSALTYLYFYPQFELYFWPGNIQHIFVITCILAVLNLYLKAQKTGSRLYLFTAIILNLFATVLCRITVVIIPVVIICDILFNTPAPEMSKKFNRWSLLFFTYLLTPLYTLIFSGDDRLAFPVLAAKNITGGWIVYSIIFIIGSITLLFIRHLPGKNFKLNNSRSLKILPLAAVAFIIVLPGFLIPPIGLFNSLFHPIENAMLIDPGHLYSISAYKIIYPLDYLGFLAILAGIAAFIVKIDVKKNIYKLFLAWYFTCALFPWLRNTLVSSRYIGYIAPVFCLMLVPVIVHIIEHICAKLKFNKDAGLILFFTPILLMNITAIKLELFRNKLITSSFNYDFIRAGNLIKQDMDKELDKSGVKAVYVSGLKPSVMPEVCEYSIPADICSCKSDFSPTYYNFRFVFAQLMPDRPRVRLFINRPRHSEKSRFAYQVEGYAITNARGKNIDAFANILEKAADVYNSGDYQQAGILFEEAADTRPFLLNYLLEGLKLEDLRWIEGKEKGFLSWMDSMFAQLVWGAHLDQGIKWDGEKIKYINQIISREASDYITVLFYRSYLSYKSGNLEESESWFKKIVYLENDPVKVLNVISAAVSIKPDIEAVAYLEKMCRPDVFTKFVIPVSGSRETYKFLLRFFVKDL